MLEWYAPFNRATLIEYLQDVRLASGVRSGFVRLKDEGIKIALVSITWKFAVEWLAAVWAQIMRLARSGMMTVRSLALAEDQAIWLQSLLAKLQIDSNLLAAVRRLLRRHTRCGAG